MEEMSRSPQEPRIAEAAGEAKGSSEVAGGFGLIIEATGHAKGSAMNALRALYEAVNETAE